MPGRSPSFLENPDLKLLLFGGKGGVGKTTTAAATALYRAIQGPEHRILIVSTDPAHSLSDSFTQPVGDDVRSIAGIPNLFALEMDAGRRLEDFKHQHGETLKTIADRGTYFDREDIAGFFDLSLPGLDELLAVIEVAGIVRKGEYDLVILDTAPTGHTLRLLALPQLMEDWVRVLDLMLAKHRYMASVFGRYRPDDTDAFLASMSTELGQLRGLLRNSNTSEFVPVTIAEAMSIEETGRLLAALDSLRLCVQTVVVNRVAIRQGCPFCEARHSAQKPYLEEIERRFSPLQLVRVPLFSREVRGPEALESYAKALLGEPTEGIVDWETGGATLPYSPISLSRLSLDVEDQGLLLFGGKGGVGKTTIAAATAIHLAQEHLGEKILLFSTDPAHSLSDSLGRHIGNRITPVDGVAGLFALEMEATEFVEELRQIYAAEINEVFDAFLPGAFDAPYDRAVTEELVSLAPPGLDELMALVKIMELMQEGTFDRYVLDMAPTGHALRFLEMPELVRQWFTAFFKMLLKYQGVVRLTQVAGLLLEKSKQLRKVHQLLTDAARCRFIAVTIPEAMAVSETRRLLHRLAELSIACRQVVVNQVMPEANCVFCTEVRNGQQEYLRELAALAPILIPVPLFSHEIRGVESLSEMATVIYGDGHDGE